MGGAGDRLAVVGVAGVVVGPGRRRGGVVAWVVGAVLAVAGRVALVAGLGDVDADVAGGAGHDTLGRVGERAGGGGRPGGGEGDDADGGQGLPGQQLLQHGLPPRGLGNGCTAPDRLDHGGDGGGRGVLVDRRQGRGGGEEAGDPAVPGRGVVGVDGALQHPGGAVVVEGEVVRAHPPGNRPLVHLRYTPFTGRSSRSASRRSARCWRTRTVPGLRPVMPATSSTGSPATTRSSTISAWSGGRSATMRRTVDMSR